MKKNAIMNYFRGGVEVAGESLPFRPVIEICGHDRVLIENHKGITDYSLRRIGVGVGFGEVVIEGENLRLCQISGSKLVIRGCIQNVALCRG